MGVKTLEAAVHRSLPENFVVVAVKQKGLPYGFPVVDPTWLTQVKPYICTMPLGLYEGWNQIQLNLADYTGRAYGTNYVETLNVQVHANCLVQRIYISDRLYSKEELPSEFKLYLPTQKA